MIVLGIETSCDETAAAVVVRAGDGPGRILSNVILSQAADHAAFGGVVPEIAARAHVEALDRIVAVALDEAGVDIDTVDAVAATAGPGLIGGVLVGLATAKAIAFAADKPLVAVNHLEGHALTARLTDGLAFPYLLLLVSGGHTQLLKVAGVGAYRRYGTTIDDALGEAFDKAARLLGLGYPGGPEIERVARGGNPKRFHLPRPMVGRPGSDFSFSGLKTALRLEAERMAPLDAQTVADLAAGFQAAATESLVDRVRHAVDRFRQEEPDVANPPLVIAGGVASNETIRSGLTVAARESGFHLVMPPPALCSDNAAMIAWAGAERLALGIADTLDASARPRWPLAAAADGPGRWGGAKGAKA
jgi:N6-L-threonylcarbamoyladenine synthase